MFLRPMVLMAGEILKTPALKEKYGAKAEEYIKLSEQMFEKWDSRGAWRETKEGGLWVVPLFGFDPKTGKWTEGYEQRKKEGFSLPDNKQNFIAHVADRHVRRDAQTDLPRAGREVVPRDEVPHETPRQRQIFRLGLLGSGRAMGPQGGWLSEALDGRAPERPVLPGGCRRDRGAYEHGLVFTKEDIARLIATNRDFMWNHQIEHAKFQRIDGEKSDPARHRRGCFGPRWRLSTRRCGRFLKPTRIRPVGAD